MEKVVQGQHFDNFDRIRGLACLLVFIQHYCAVLQLPWFNSIPQCLSIGTSGVFLFFVMSGFLVTMAVKDMFSNDPSKNFLERLQESKKALIQFYIKRFYRIFPMVFLTLGLIATFLIIIHMLNIREFSTWIIEYVKNFIEIIFGLQMYSVAEYQYKHFIYNIGIAPLWTIGIDMTFYLIWPLVLAFMVKTHHRVLFCFTTAILGLFVIDPVVIHTCLTGTNNSIYYYSHFTNFSTFMLGSLFALLYTHKTETTKIDKTTATLQKTLSSSKQYDSKLWKLAPYLIFLILWIYPSVYTYDRIAFYRAIPQLTSALLILFSIYKEKLFLAGGLGNVLDYIGSRSYSLYLLSSILANATSFGFENYISKRALGTSFDLLFALTLIIIVFALSELSYRYIELRYRKIGRSIATNYNG